MKNGIIGPSLIASTLTPAMSAASFTGFFQGLRQTTLNSTELEKKTAAADNLLKTIQEALKIYDSRVVEDNDHFSGLDNFKGALGEDDYFPMVNSTRQKVGAVPQLLSGTVGAVASHGLQSTADVSIAGLSVSKQPFRPINHKLIDNFNANYDHFSACLNFFLQTIHGEMKDLSNNIKKEFPLDDHSAVEAHEVGAIGSGVSSSAVLLTPVVLMSVLADTVGTLLRNFKGSIKDTENFNRQEKRVLKALDKCCIYSLAGDGKPLKESCFKSLENLDVLITELKDLQASQKQISDELVTGARPIFKLASLATIPFISSLKLVTDSALGLMWASELIKQEKLLSQPSQLAKRASSLDEKEVKSHSHNIKSLTARFKEINQALMDIMKNHPKNQTSDKGVALSVGVAVNLSASICSFIPLLLLELGSIIRETAAATRFSADSNKKIEDQSSIVSRSDEKIGEELDQLFFEAVKTQDALAKVEEFGVSSPFSLGLSRSILAGGTIGIFNGLLGALSAIREMQRMPKTISGLRDSMALQPEEKQKVVETIGELKQIHRNSFASKSTSAPKAISLENSLESVLNKVILMNRVSETNVEELKDRKDLNSTGKASIVAGSASGSAITRSSEFLTGALAAVALVFLESGINTEILLRGIGNSLVETIRESGNSKRFSDGPDKINISQNSDTNLSFLCNALRFLAESKSHDLECSRESVLSTAKLLETIASRSLILFLMQYNILSPALDKLTKDQEAKNQSSVLGAKTLALAKEDVISGLAKAIVQQLQNIGARDIPGLNEDMASQLQSLSQPFIVSALSTEMTLIEPFLVLSGLSRAGSQGDVSPRHDEEALIDSSPSKQVSIFSNIIQGFTLAFIKAAESIEDNVKDPLLQAHFSARELDKLTFKSSGYTGLALAECVSFLVGRGFTLLNREKISKETKELGQVAKDKLKNNLSLSTGEVKADSHCGEANSVIYSISGLRSSLLIGIRHHAN